MYRSTPSFHAILPALLWIAILAAPALAQQPTNNQGIFDDYYASGKSLQQQHQQKLAEIDEHYKAALLAYREENVKRAQSLPELNTAEHKALREKGLKGEQRQSEFERIQTEDKKRRAEYAEWRDSTARRLQEERDTARSAEIERHKAEMGRLLADRNAKLAGIRALDGSIGLTPGAAAALHGAETTDAAAASGTDEASGDDGEADAEVNVDGLEMLGRASDGQAGIGTGDDGLDSGTEPADSGGVLGGLEMLERANDGQAGIGTVGDASDSESGDSTAGSVSGSRMSDLAPPRPLPPVSGIGDDDLLGDENRTLPVPAGVEPQEAGTRIAVAYPNTGDLVEIGESGVSAQAFELSATTAVGKTVRRMNFRVLRADGTIVTEQDVCGTGAASSTECGSNPRFSDLVDFSGAGAGTHRLAVQVLDSAGDAVSRVVEFELPYRAVIAPVDVEVAAYDPEVANDECRWLVSGSLIDWDGKPVAGHSLFVESRRHKGNGRVREEREWTDWKGEKWGAVTTNAGGHFSLRSQKLDNCGGDREFRIFTQVGQWTINLGQVVLTREAATIVNPFVLPRAETNTTFDIITYNVALIIGGGRENRQREYRAKNIGRRLHRYHVVVLNEALRGRFRGMLIRELQNTWRDAGFETHFAGDGGPLLNDGGVDIMSRLPMLEEHAMEYNNEAGKDAWAAKGAVHARVQADSGQLIDIFATHLQSGGDGRSDTRAQQIGQLRDFIMRHSDPDVPFLILGDLNLKTPEEQSNAIRILQEARPGVRDAWQWKGDGECVTKPDSARCLDFIFIGNVSGDRPMELDRVATRKFEDAVPRRRYLSDHFGVEAGFTVTPGGRSQ